MNAEKMPAATFARKVKARISDLQNSLEVARHNYHRDVKRWRMAMAAWLKDTPERIKHINLITEKELQNHEGRYEKTGFDVSRFFESAPKPPKSPEEIVENIARCRAALRQVSFTGQKTVLVGNDMMRRLFGDVEEG